MPVLGGIFACIENCNATIGFNISHLSGEIFPFKNKCIWKYNSFYRKNNNPLGYWESLPE